MFNSVEFNVATFIQIDTFCFELMKGRGKLSSSVPTYKLFPKTVDHSNLHIALL